MWIEIIFNEPIYKIFIDNVHFQRGHYKLHIDSRIKSCVSCGGMDSIMEYLNRRPYINKPIITVKGSDFYAEENNVVIEDVQWDTVKNEPSPKYTFELPNKRTLKTLPLKDVRFFYINVCPQAVLLEELKK